MRATILCAMLFLFALSAAGACRDPFCPGGTVKVEERMSGGVQRFCTDDSGRRVGQYRFESARLSIKGQYLEGRPDGEWLWSLADPRRDTGADAKSSYVWHRYRSYTGGQLTQQEELCDGVEDGRRETWSRYDSPTWYKTEESTWDCGVRLNVRGWVMAPDYQEILPYAPPYPEVSAARRAACATTKKVVQKYLAAISLPRAP